MAGTDSLLCASALELLRDAIGGFFDKVALTIEGGMERFPETLARNMEDRIRYRTRVIALDQHENAVIVHCDTGSFEADYAVVTIPFSVLRYVDIRKPFSAAKQRAIRGLHYEPAAKLFLVFRAVLGERRDHWRDQLHGLAYSKALLPRGSTPT